GVAAADGLAGAGPVGPLPAPGAVDRPPAATVVDVVDAPVAGPAPARSWTPAPPAEVAVAAEPPVAMADAAAEAGAGPGSPGAELPPAELGASATWARRQDPEPPVDGERRGVRIVRIEPRQVEVLGHLQAGAEGQPGVVEHRQPGQRLVLAERQYEPAPAHLGARQGALDGGQGPAAP